MLTVPSDHIVTRRLTIRRETADDAAAVAASIGRNRDRLLPWLGWATEEAASVEAQTVRITRSGEQWDAGEMFDYAIVDRATGTFWGKISMHRRIGPRGVELGYWLDGAAEGRGVMTEAVAMIRDEALGLDWVDRVEIHCDAANVRSRAIPRRLGFELDRSESRVATAASETGMCTIWLQRKTTSGRR
ncbi:GNAT family N-acetyltransferase [Rhodococcus sp. BP-241]|jgi:RimJ/RimL family protein N-acetyltransferase|uniref:GNAT family N-acetyltransferase n=1 Tax=Rhodococcus sp. BP-241 TaxID=2739441 RepID=UPI001C9B6447|nr:GNAT family N-acetyltransferase [Rhodococcus sp. BP-241]MBY6708728.1 GNAT family N-acetyltransferase [Rhodococcus sp. BP-241]